MARKMARKKWQPAAWQKDPGSLKTARVQVWSSSGTMLTAQMPLEDARRFVAEGRAFVITAQAIGFLEGGK